MGHISKKLILSEVAGNTEQRQQTPKIHPNIIFSTKCIFFSLKRDVFLHKKDLLSIYSFFI
jgi:hypothetical protein